MLWEQIERLRSLSVDVRSLRAMSPEEQDVLLMERKPEAGEGYADKRKVFVALTKAVEEDRKARADDPAAYLVSVEPEVKAARQTMLQDIAKQLALKEALGTVEKERDDLKRDLEAKETEKKLLESSLNQSRVKVVMLSRQMAFSLSNTRRRISGSMALFCGFLAGSCGCAVM